MEIATSGHVDWPFFDAIVSKKLTKHNLSLVDLQITRSAFKMFCSKGGIYYIIVSYNRIFKFLMKY